jgi:hypothetical protein
VAALVNSEKDAATGSASDMRLSRRTLRSAGKVITAAAAANTLSNRNVTGVV